MYTAKILLILFTILYSTVCLAADGPLFNPQSIRDLWYVWAGHNGPATDIFCSHWDGAKWSKPEQLTDSSTSNFTPAVALNKDGHPWVVWAKWDGVSTSIYCRHWDGNNWSKAIQVDDVDIYSDSTPAITIDENNIPWVIWAGSDGIDDDIYVSSWNGKNWSTPTMINTDDATPDIMPVVSCDKQNNIITVWCGFENDRYKLFYSKKIKNNWHEPKTVVQNEDRFSADLPNILKRKDKEIELLWYEKNLCFKSLWNGSAWSDPKPAEFLLPENFFKAPSIGPAYISWARDNIYQSLRILPPLPQKKLTACSKYSRGKRISWIKDILCPSAYADEGETKYIAFGNSITEGVGATDRSKDAYPPRLQEKLNANIGASVVINEGVGGERAIHGADRIDSVLVNNSAQYILIMEGTNDMSWGYSPETITHSLGRMIDNSVIFGTTPLLATLPPRTDGLAVRVNRDVNPAIENLAEEKGITLVDQYTELAKNTEKYMFDRLHPNDAGYEIMSNNWYNAINDLVNPPDDGGGCGALPPIYRNGRYTGFGNNILPILILAGIILFFRRKWLTC